MARILEVDAAEELLSNPARWAGLTEAALSDLVLMACWLYGVSDDDEATRSRMGQLYGHAAQTLPRPARCRIVTSLGGALEEWGRHLGSCPVRGLFPVLFGDPDFTVVSTAALTAAQVMAPEGKDPLTGPKAVLEAAVKMQDLSRQEAFVCGLATLGDPRVLALIGDDWQHLDPQVQSGVLSRMGNNPPTLAAIEFLVSRVEEAMRARQEDAAGQALASLVRLAESANVGHALCPGPAVLVLERQFPSWSLPDGESPIRLRETMTPRAAGALIGPRLNRVAAGEGYPRLIPLVLRTWGQEDEAFVKAVRHAAAGFTIQLRSRTRLMLEKPVEIDPKPAWDGDDVVLEWGILNPFGPTKVQLSLVPVSPSIRALVYTLHNPVSPVSLFVGLAAGRTHANVRKLLLELADRFEFGDHVLLQALPHWVHATKESGLLADGALATFFERLHQAALSRGLAPDGDVEEAIEELARLRGDAQGEIARQITDMLETALAGELPERPARIPRRRTGRRPARVRDTSDSYRRWVTAASDPDQVEAISSQFLDCWQAASRLRSRA